MRHAWFLWVPLDSCLQPEAPSPTDLVSDRCVPPESRATEMLLPPKNATRNQRCQLQTRYWTKESKRQQKVVPSLTPICGGMHTNQPSPISLFSRMQLPRVELDKASPAPCPSTFHCHSFFRFAPTWIMDQTHICHVGGGKKSNAT